MGYMTEVSILNDRWDEIRKEAEAFVEELYAHSITGNCGFSPYVIGQTTVAKSHHADDVRVYFAGRNSFFDAYPEKDMPLSSLKRHLEILKEMKGYLKIAETATKAAIEKEEAKNA